MIEHKTVFYSVMENEPNDNYLTGEEIDDFLRNLSASEFRLYVTYMEMSDTNTKEFDLSNKNLAALMGISESSVANAKTGLKKKGYLLIENVDDVIHLVLGKEAIQDYLNKTKETK